MQLTPGQGFSGTVSLTCSGAPFYATCQVPASLTVANGVALPFKVSVLTSGSAVLPPSTLWRFVPPARIRVLLLLTFALFLAIIARNRVIFDGAIGLKRLTWSRALTAILFCSVIYAAGCGSSATTTPPPQITPSGTSTITITMTAMSSTQQPLQLPPIQLTLTVK